MKEKLRLTINAAAFILLGASLAVDNAPTHPEVALGTHAPKEAAHVWRFLTKAGDVASAVPVKVDGTTAIYLTAGHNVRNLKSVSIVQDKTTLRKFKVTRHLAHPTVDIGILWATSDGKEVKVIEPNVTEDLDVGLSVFAVGYPYPSFKLSIFRGYLGGDAWMTAPVFPAMSGGAVLTNDGWLIGIVRGFGQGGYGTTPVHDNTQAHKTIGHIHNSYEYNAQGVFIPLKPLAEWLRENKIIE